MKVYILVDENSIVRDLASEKCNLEGVGMIEHYVDFIGIVGDEYDSETDTWISRPENYPQPSEAEINEIKIEEEMKILTRATAIQNLKDREELPTTYKEITRF